MIKRNATFAQKAVLLDATQRKMLLVPYKSAKYTKDRVIGKYGLPGGRYEDSDNSLDEGFIREVLEETGITIEPSLPFYVFTWEYVKGDSIEQIIAVARIAYYKSGRLTESNSENEVTLGLPKWIEIDSITREMCIDNEYSVIEAYRKYRLQSPFNKSQS